MSGRSVSFRRYMVRRPTHVASATGAFTLAYRSDPDAPNARSRAELLDYLRQRGATEEVLRAARSCWDSYIRACDCGQGTSAAARRHRFGGH